MSPRSGSPQPERLQRRGEKHKIYFFAFSNNHEFKKFNSGYKKKINFYFSPLLHEYTWKEPRSGLRPTGAAPRMRPVLPGIQPQRSLQKNKNKNPPHALYTWGARNSSDAGKYEKALFYRKNLSLVCFFFFVFVCARARSKHSLIAL